MYVDKARAIVRSLTRLTYLAHQITKVDIMALKGEVAKAEALQRALTEENGRLETLWKVALDIVQRKGSLSPSELGQDEAAQGISSSEGLNNLD